MKNVFTRKNVKNPSNRNTLESLTNPNTHTECFVQIEEIALIFVKSRDESVSSISNSF